MASLTVRQLDDKVKKLLRLRAARHGRSMEDEIRTILRPGRTGGRTRGRRSVQPAARAARLRRGSPSRAVRRLAGAEPARRASGGDRAPRAADHRRRHRGLQIARPHPPPAGSRRRPCAASSPRRRRNSSRRSPPARWRAAQVVHRPVRSEMRIRRRPHPARARHRSGRGRARHRRPDGEDGGRPCRRSRQRGAARHRQADPDRAGDEPDDVGAQGDAAQSRAADRRRRR